MTRQRTPGALLAAAWLAAIVASAPAHGQELPDAPDASFRPATTTPAVAVPATYDDALATWQSPEDIAAFAGRAFVYDRARAIALGEPAAGAAERRPIHAPAVLYAKPQGVCVDLARFGVETLNRLDAAFAARYLMIEFEPVVVEGRTLRRHWIASFRRDGRLWFFADSRRPGHIAGPYDNVEAFVADYARYRGRPIVAWREADSLLRRERTRASAAKGSVVSQ